MSNKRGSGYRKNVLSELDEFHEPKENEALGRVVGSRGGNTFEIAKWSVEGKEEIVLAILPTRYRKLIWLKRGDYVIISAGDISLSNEESLGSRITHMVEKILRLEQCKYLNEKGLWPWPETFIADAKIEKNSKNLSKKSEEEGIKREELGESHVDDKLESADVEEAEEDEDYCSEADMGEFTRNNNRQEFSDSSDDDKDDGFKF